MGSAALTLEIKLDEEAQNFIFRKHDFCGTSASRADEYERRFHPNEFPAKPLSRNSPALQL